MLQTKRRTARIARTARHLAPWLAALTLMGLWVPAHAGDRLLATWGVSQVEGAGGGGLTPWALITGSGSRNQTGATAYATTWHSQGGFDLRAAGAALGWHDTVEVSASHWRFGLGDTVPGASLGLDVIGAKWRVWGDAIQDQDRWWPQLAVGAQYKRNTDMAVPTALGARHAEDLDLYAAATKVWLGGLAGRNVLANLTLRATRANQFGLLGFGGDRGDARRLQAEGSVAVLLRDDLALGAEWRDKPDNLSVFREQSAADLFVAWFPSRHLSVTLGWLNLGNVADKASQRGGYLSLQLAL
jgi:hypothetical protein